MSVKIKSVKLMSVINKVRKNIGQFQYGFSGISDQYHRLVGNCLLKQTMVCLLKQFLKAKIGVYIPENEKISGDCRA